MQCVLTRSKQLSMVVPNAQWFSEFPDVDDIEVPFSPVICEYVGLVIQSVARIGRLRIEERLNG